MFDFQFYPTPERLADKMMSKIKWDDIKYILEPSAGSGNLVDAVRKKHREVKDKRNVKPFVHVEVCEIDNNLRSILKDKSVNLVGTDFLEYNSFTRYDLIVMNPPFADGDKHLLKALELMRYGGQIVCILNAETIRNPHTIYRQQLVDKLLELNADIEYCEDEFISAERTTDVEVALIYVDIPKGGMFDENAFKDMIKGDDYHNRNIEYGSDSELATNDFINNIIKQYEFECKAGLQLIDSYYQYAKFIPKVNQGGYYAADHSLLQLSCLQAGDGDEETDFNIYQTYVRGLRSKYWNTLFNSEQLSKLMTEAMRTKLRYKLREFKDYDFNFSNIKQLQINLVGSLNENVDEAILKQFDNLTYQWSNEKNGNVHYFNGWCTNNAYKVKNKVIVPCYSYSRYSTYTIDNAKVRDYLVELEKIFTYLDGGKTPGEDVCNILRNAPKPYNSERVSFKYFDAEFKKKETLHIWFTNDDLLKKFNIFGCNKHGWLPNDYGKKRYNQMSKEEQEVINSFEGKESYESVCSNPELFLGQNSLLMLEVK